jgi:hypothetical protein
MPLHRRTPFLHLVRLAALGLVLALLPGCSGDDDTSRVAGSPITEAEADVLAQALYRNHQEGGADFVVTAPFAEGALLTLTGEVDFARGIGRAQAVTSYPAEQDRPDDTRTLFFTADTLWLGDVPGLAEALSGAGLPAAGYVRRPITTVTQGGTASLIDVLVQLVPALSARQPDDPRSFLERDYTWQGTQSVDGQLASVFQSGTGARTSIAADSKLLVQYVTRLSGQQFDVTVTLSDHGPRDIALPADTDTVDATAHPEIATALGL